MPIAGSRSLAESRFVSFARRRTRDSIDSPIIAEKLHVLRRIFLEDFDNRRSTFLICRPFSDVLVRHRCSNLDRRAKNGVADRDDLSVNENGSAYDTCQVMRSRRRRCCRRLERARPASRKATGLRSNYLWRCEIKEFRPV